MNKPLPHTSAPLEEQAHAWLARLNSGDLDQEGRAEFERWRAESPAHAQAFRQAERLWAMLDAPLRADRQRRLAAKPPPRLARWRRMGLGLAVAALLVLAVGLGLFPDYLREPGADYRTHIGEQTSIRLADGSMIHLNTDTALDVAFDAAQRRVVLRHGEAVFEVACDNHRPFRVVSGQVLTEAVGTRFVVRYDGSAGRVALVEGKVRTAFRRGKGLADEAVALRPGEGVSFTAAGLTGASPVDALAAEAWRRGRLVMNFATLQDVVAEINRYRRGQVILLGDRLARREINVAIDLDHIDAWLDALKDSLPVGVSRVGPFVWLRS